MPFSTISKKYFPAVLISENGINCNQWHQKFSSLDAGGKKGESALLSDRLCHKVGIIM